MNVLASVSPRPRPGDGVGVRDTMAEAQASALGTALATVARSVLLQSGPSLLGTLSRQPPRATPRRLTLRAAPFIYAPPSSRDAPARVRHTAVTARRTYRRVRGRSRASRPAAGERRARPR